MPRARHLVEDDAGDADARIVGRAAQRHRGGGLGGPRDVEHQDDRPAVAGGDVGVGPAAAFARDDAVEEPHRALSDHEVGPVMAMPGDRVEQGSGIAKLSRLTLGAPVAAWWKAGSM